MAIFMVTVYPKIKEQADVRKMAINDIPLSDIIDGTFRGDFNYGDFTYEVEVIVQEHVIKDIKILENRQDSEYARKATAVVNNVLKAQSLNVDVVTGATTTSKALLKAIENALAKGFQE
jgi:uncharacterized protein with FMN-binding domain